MSTVAEATIGAKQLVEKQRKYFNTGVTKPYEFRLAQLKKLKAALEKHEKAIIDGLYADLRKSAMEAYATEHTITMADIDFAIKNLATWMKPERVSTPLFFMPGKSRIHSEPYGVTLTIAPWNYPFKNLIGPVIGALTAGNTMILKPSELAPATSKAIAAMVADFFEPEYMTVVEGGVKETQELLEEPYDFIMFTGGTEIGRIIYQAAAKHLTPVALELGGKSPCIVDGDVNLEVAARRITWGKFTNAGQICIAPDYIYVHKDVKPKFLALVKENITEFFGADPKQSPDLGRIVSVRHFNRIKNLIDGDVIVGGQTDESEKYIAPTVIDNVTPQSKVMQEEIFGPIMPIMEYDTIDEVISHINKGSKPLALYIFSNRSSLADRIITETSSGAVLINDVLVHAGHPNLPFGGVGSSGMGAYNGKISFDTYSHRKGVLTRSFMFDVKQRYAPYNEKNIGFLKFAIRKLIG